MGLSLTSAKDKMFPKNRRAVLVLALAFPLLASCGETTVTEYQASPAPSIRPASVVDRSPELKRIEEHARASFEQWAGSVDDLQAAEVIIAYSNNADQDECVKARGVTSWHDWRYAIGVVQVPFYYDSNILLLPPVHHFTFDPLVNAPSESLEKELRKSPPPGIDKILDACSFEVDSAGPLLGKMGEEEVLEMVDPAVIDRLSEKWNEAVTEATADLPSYEETINCVRGSTPEPPLTGVKPGREELEGWLDAVNNSIPAPELVGTDAVAWRVTLAKERALVKAIWACTSETYEQAVEKLPAVVQEFESQNASEIGKARQSWAHVRDLATAMGWKPGDPLAGLDIPSS